MSRQCADPEQVTMVASEEAVSRWNTGSGHGKKEAVDVQVGYPELGGLLVLVQIPGQPPGLVA